MILKVSKSSRFAQIVSTILVFIIFLVLGLRGNSRDTNTRTLGPLNHKASFGKCVFLCHFYVSLSFFFMSMFLFLSFILCHFYVSPFFHCHCYVSLTFSVIAMFLFVSLSLLCFSFILSLSLLCLSFLFSLSLPCFSSFLCFSSFPCHCYVSLCFSVIAMFLFLSLSLLCFSVISMFLFLSLSFKCSSFFLSL